MNPKVCVSISSTDTPELLGRAQRAERLSADLVEVRLDKLRSYHGLTKIARAVERPIIGTNRPLSEKGSFDRSEAERLKILMEAVEGGFQYVDLELTTSRLDRIIKTFRDRGAKIILSHHDHFRTPDSAKLTSTLVQLQKFKPDVCKIVTTAQIPEDNLTILSLLKTNHQNSPLVSFAMGRAGVWSRLLAPFYGAHFTYASLERGMETAPGQSTIAELRRIYELLGVE
ncbi:MAG TPA: type I 3-dehydroquinate dehydratase [Candidatus Bathyarchaeia archaeon]|nr:type I 3-dehydroquinate dehydratase [Candidatus Bathyarchaeia archaeon]